MKRRTCREAGPFLARGREGHPGGGGIRGLSAWECAPVAAPAEVSPLSIAERVYATNVPQARLLNAATVKERHWRGISILAHRCGNTIPGPWRGRQSCRFCSPSGQPIGRCRAPADRGPSSNPPRFFCHWQRFGGFLESGLLAPPQAALRRFPLFWTSPPEKWKAGALLARCH